MDLKLLLFKCLSLTGSAKAKENLAELYFDLAQDYKYGLDKEIDIDKALEYYQQAAELDNADAMIKLGIMYERANSVKKIIKKHLIIIKKLLI